MLCSKSSIILKQKIIWGNKISNGIVFPVNVTCRAANKWLFHLKICGQEIIEKTITNIFVQPLFSTQNLTQFQSMLSYKDLLFREKEIQSFLFYTGNKIPSHFLQYCLKKLDVLDLQGIMLQTCTDTNLTKSNIIFHKILRYIVYYQVSNKIER